jgi:hypothetical protein
VWQTSMFAHLIDNGATNGCDYVPAELYPTRRYMALILLETKATLGP